jgi:glycosidase
VPDEERRHFADPHAYLRALRAFLGRRAGDAILLGEVNLPHEEQLTFFGGQDGNELTMLFDFITMQQMYLAMARKDAGPLVRALTSRPVLNPDSHWATFVRNHDELTLDKLTDDERQEVFAAFGPEPRMQVYGRGLKRRLPPMLDGDPQRIRMVYSLLFSLPGTPVLYYGEEIGMGEDLDADGRNAVRTPMQWTSDADGGFSTAPLSRLVARPVPGRYGPEHVNAAGQRRDPGSLWSFVAMLAQRYRECPELGWGDFTVLDQPHPQVLAHRCSWTGGTVVALHNLGDEPVTVPLPLGEQEPGTRLVDLLAPGSTPLDPSGAAELDLQGYGYRWLRLDRPGERQLP